MTTPFPVRADLFPAGGLDPATFKVELAKFFDAAVALLGADGLTATARSRLGLDSIIGTAGALSGRNRIVGDFSVNQRLRAAAGDGTYCADRWYVLTESGLVTVAHVDDPESGALRAVRLTQPDASPKRMGLAHIIEARNIKEFRSQAMNFFMRVKPSFAGNVRYAILEHTGAADSVTSDVVNNWASTNFTAGNFFIGGVNVIKTGVIAPGAATYGDLSDYGVMGAALNNAILFVWSESAMAQNATLELNRPQFEPGIVATPHEWRLNELELCQRYFDKSYALTTPPAAVVAVTTQHAFVALPASISDSFQYGYVPFKVRKRTAPTIAVYNSNGDASRANNDSGVNYGANTAVPVYATEIAFTVANSSGSSLAINFGTAYIHWTADAEI